MSSHRDSNGEQRVAARKRSDTAKDRDDLDSDLGRDDKRRPIPSVPVRQEAIGLFVADDLLRFGIETQRPAEAV